MAVERREVRAHRELVESVGMAVPDDPAKPVDELPFRTVDEARYVRDNAQHHLLPQLVPLDLPPCRTANLQSVEHPIRSGIQVCRQRPDRFGIAVHGRSDRR